MSRATANRLETRPATTSPSTAVHVQRDLLPDVIISVYYTLVRSFSLALTFTPFASVRPCSGRYIFCSETLQHREQKRLSASLRPGATYFRQLRQALSDLRTLLMGLSLSGLEQTDDADFFEGIINTIVDHRQSGGAIRDVVLYSNGAGLARSTTAERLLPLLREVSRVEFSRHSNQQDRNDAIMRFRPDVAVAEQAVFEQVVQDAHAFSHVRLVCVVQHGGVDDAATVMSNLRWAAELGVKDVVFRELSRLGDTYKANRTLPLVEERRVGIEGLFEGVHQELKLLHMVDGYYYWNVACTFEDMRVNKSTPPTWFRSLSSTRTELSARTGTPTERSSNAMRDHLQVAKWVAQSAPALLVGSVALRLLHGETRVPNDVDFVVPFSSLDPIASALMAKGYAWQSWENSVSRPSPRTHFKDASTCADITSRCLCWT
ncbi:MAG: hypothetical protein ACI9KE_002346 [Polyangiales bacterium]|jgi:hypothetical protein